MRCKSIEEYRKETAARAVAARRSAEASALLGILEWDLKLTLENKESTNA